MPEDSIKIKVTVDTSDIEAGIHKGVKKGILAEAKELRREMLGASSSLSKRMFSSDPKERTEAAKLMRVNTSSFRAVDRLVNNILKSREKGVDYQRRVNILDKQIQIAEKKKNDAILVSAAKTQDAIQKERVKTEEDSKRRWDKTAAEIKKKTTLNTDLFTKKTELEELRHNDKLKEISDTLQSRESYAATQTIETIKRQDNLQKNRIDLEDRKQSNKLEYASEQRNNQEILISEREASRRRIIALQEANRAQRLSSAGVNVFGGLIGSLINFPASIKDAKQFGIDYDLGKRMAGRMKTLHPEYDPYADPGASAGFRAGYAGDSKMAGIIGKAAPAIAAAVGIIALFKKTVLDQTLKVGKKVVGYFVDIARQTETLQTLFNLIALPFKIIFTLGFIEPLLAFIPILKEMINWVTSNQEVIQKISDTLARVFTDVFTEDRIGFVSVLLDKFAGVLQFLADSLATNMETVNTSNVASFIASTITSVVGFIQDLLMGIVAFCYSPEGQAFVIKMAEGIGRLIGTLLDLFIAMLPIFLEMAVFTIIGIVEGVISTVWKAIANLFDIIDKATGGALTGFVNGIIAIANWVIDRINDVIDFLNNVPFINIGRLGNVASWDSGSIGSNFGTAATNMWNSSNFYNSTTVTNYNSLSNSDTMRSLMMTGI